MLFYVQYYLKDESHIKTTYIVYVLLYLLFKVWKTLTSFYILSQEPYYGDSDIARRGGHYHLQKGDGQTGIRFYHGNIGRSCDVISLLCESYSCTD